MSQETAYPQCNEASIKRITALVDAEIQSDKSLSSTSKNHPIHMKKVILAATLALLSLSSLAFAENIDLPQILKQAYSQLFSNETMANKALNYMQPLEGSSIFNGIKAELIGYIRANDMVYITFSLQDLESDRLDENTFIYDYSIKGYDSDTIEPYGSNSVYGFDSGVNILHASPINSPEISLVSYDAVTKTATFNYRFYNHEISSLFADGSREFFKKLEFTINLIASGAKEGEASLNLKSALTEDTYSPSTLQADFNDFWRNGYSGTSEQLQTFLVPDECHLTLLDVPGVIISNYGIINGRLHVQVKYDRPHDVSINRILDMTLKTSEKVWNAPSEVYLTNGEYTGTVCRFKDNNAYYAEYIFDLPAGFTADDLEVLYHYRTYDYILGMDEADFINLPESDINNALWQLNFSPSVTLKEQALPFKICSNGTLTHETTGYISSIGLMLLESPNAYTDLYYLTFMQNMSLTLCLEDGTTKEVSIADINGCTKPDQTGKTQFLFSEFVELANIQEVVLNIP